MSTESVYPARVRGELQPGLSRWLWLVKWLLAIPHYLILLLLWIAFFGVSVIAFFAILFTARYPRSLFDFNVGVLRWTWRVGFYTYGALGTDRYPPFSLGPEPDYPATLDIAYPERLSRGLVLVKWWLLAIPQYVVVGIFLGTYSWPASHHGWHLAASGGLVGVLVFFAGVVLLFRGRYPRALFDFVVGLDRWAIRVAAYAALMTDRYPPFRLDQGPDEPELPAPVEPGAPPTPFATPVPATTPPASGLAPPDPAARLGAEAVGAPESAPHVIVPAPAATGSRWTAGRVVLVVLGSIAALVGAGFLIVGIAAIVVDQTQRNDAGFLVSPSETFRSPGYAVVSRSARMSLGGQAWVARRILGTVTLESDSVRPVFLGIGPEDAVDSYLGGVQRSVVQQIDQRPRYDEEPGGAPAGPPAQQSFWAASATGAGKQTLTWKPVSGDWVAVLMNADGSSGVEAEVAIGAKVDQLLGVGIGAAVGGGLLLLIGALSIALGATRAARDGPEPSLAQ